MSSKEFWEEDPQLYWSYRTFYIKKMEQEAKKINYVCWLEGNYNCLATSVSLNNAFSKKKIEYPKEPLGEEKNKSKTKFQKELEKEKNPDVRNQMEFNYWARL